MATDCLRNWRQPESSTAESLVNSLLSRPGATGSVKFDTGSTSIRNLDRTLGAWPTPQEKTLETTNAGGDRDVQGNHKHAAPAAINTAGAQPPSSQSGQT
ncbi:hypothetical protein K469DRAFT_143905 [Zopfia rhizophila CBS 207.26]|uniref:Uncharacterized protein n=1 Tax=Zopfia rhizophila CBS 207.26 TaxID=1314779 RepID=A0A6A6E4H1_9PEZI|nr:hypothetical protein K469DRAFT_143905 [Zopfia rhizophila CBS 207.26]